VLVVENLLLALHLSAPTGADFDRFMRAANYSLQEGCVGVARCNRLQHQILELLMELLLSPLSLPFH
jgi:hypothetical protein